MNAERRAAMAPLMGLDTGPQPLTPPRRIRTLTARLGGTAMLVAVPATIGGLAGGAIAVWLRLWGWL